MRPILVEIGLSMIAAIVVGGFCMWLLGVL